MAVDENWRIDLERWLEPFLAGLSHPARRRMCPLYVAGLIGPGDRKSVQPMAARVDEVGYDQLHHFVAAGIWDSAPLEAALLAEADRLVGGDDAFLVIDDTALPKKRRHSVGVAPQYASSLGKTSNSQSLVSVTLASGEVPVMVSPVVSERKLNERPGSHDAPGYRPNDRPPCRSRDCDRGDRPRHRIWRSLRLRACRRGLRIQRAIPPCTERARSPLGVGMSRRQMVYPADVAMIFPTEKARKPRKHHIHDRSPASAEEMLVRETWRKLSWRRGTKGPLVCHFAARRVRIADGHKHRIFDKGVSRMPGDQAGIIGERRSTGE